MGRCVDSRSFYCCTRVNPQEDPEGSLQAINSWISSQTQDLVKDTLPPGSLDSSAALVVVNSLYFKVPPATKWREEQEEEVGGPADPALL